MTTTVILEGAMGAELGREWKFQNIRSARHAMGMIEANTGKAMVWIRNNLQKYRLYRVICEYADGRKSELDTACYQNMTQRGVSTLRFVPMAEGASGVMRTVVGLVIMAVGAWTGQTWAVQLGAGLALGGVAEMLAPKPKTNTGGKEEATKNSHYFSGAANVSTQGMPVQLIYGRCKVGSQAISAAMTVDQLL